MSTAYWEMRYTDHDSIEHHSRQNLRIATDFCSHARSRKIFADALSCESIIEIGCGTGELSVMVKAMYSTSVYYATDFCVPVVKVANDRYPAVNFWKYDILKDDPFRRFDLAISSNTLEHFADPYTVITRMFDLAPTLLFLVPYEQPVTDGYDAEGGAGHVFKFSEKTFSQYTIRDSFTFETRGWNYSSEGEIPLQLAVLISE